MKVKTFYNFRLSKATTLCSQLINGKEDTYFQPDKVHKSNYFVKHFIFHIPRYLDFDFKIICDHEPRHFFLNSSGLCRYSAAASPFNGSVGLGYVSNCGKNDSKMFARSVSAKITLCFQYLCIQK